MIISHIVAVSQNNVIGNKGDLPWNIPEDLQWFKDKTKGKIIIMGRKTFDSLGKPLPNRKNIVITRQKNLKIAGADVVGNLEEALKLAEKYIPDYDPEVFIGGGGEIYKESLPKTNRIYLTRIYREFKGDAYYPDLPKEFREVARLDRQEPIPFSILTYERVP